MAQRNMAAPAIVTPQSHTFSLPYRYPRAGLTGTGRHALTADERAALGTLADRFPLLQ